MFARILMKLHLTRGQKAVAFAYAAVMAVAAGISLMIMSAVNGGTAIPPEPTLYDNWIVLVGGLAAGVALYVSRGWLGGRGALGVARAGVATIIVTCVTAILTGLLVAPFYGVIAGPVVVLSEFAASPVVAAAWIAILFAAHMLFGLWRQEQEAGAHVSAVSQLSALSRENLYRH